MKRLVKVAKEYNVGTSTIIEFLNKNGFDYRNTPTQKISNDAYNIIEIEFAKSKEIGTKAKSIDAEKLNEIYKRANRGNSNFYKRKFTRITHSHNHAQKGERRSLDNNKLITSLAHGEINFFDYSVNKFGFIKNVSFFEMKENN